MVRLNLSMRPSESPSRCTDGTHKITLAHLLWGNSSASAELLMPWGGHGGYFLHPIFYQKDKNQMHFFEAHKCLFDYKSYKNLRCYSWWFDPWRITPLCNSIFCEPESTATCALKLKSQWAFTRTNSRGLWCVSTQRVHPAGRLRSSKRLLGWENF